MAYGLSDFGRMIIDEARRKAYLEALDRAELKGKRVLDLGCGSGFFSLEAAARGASHVCAVELVSTVELLQQVVSLNGMDDVISVSRGDVRELELEPFDVIISDLRGSSPFYAAHLDVLAYANEHLLAPDGCLMPRRDRLFIAPVCLPEWFERITSPWALGQHDWSPYRQIQLSKPFQIPNVAETDLTATAQQWAEIDYHDLASLKTRHWHGEAEFVSTVDGPVHGLVIFFDGEVADGIAVTNAPSELQPTYGRFVLPIGEPLSVAEGEIIKASIAVHRVANDWVWSWTISTENESRELSTLDTLALRSGT